MTLSEMTYCAAADVADKLLAEHLPIVGFDVFDMGEKAAFALQLPDGKRTAFRVPRELLDVDRVREMILAHL